MTRSTRLGLASAAAVAAAPHHTRTGDRPGDCGGGALRRARTMGPARGHVHRDGRGRRPPRAAFRARGGLTGGADAIWAFTADVDGTAAVTVKTTGASWDQAFYVRTTCGAAASQVACVDSQAAGTPETTSFAVGSRTGSP